MADLRMLASGAIAIAGHSSRSADSPGSRCRVRTLTARQAEVTDREPEGRLKLPPSVHVTLDHGRLNARRESAMASRPGVEVAAPCRSPTDPSERTTRTGIVGRLLATSSPPLAASSSTGDKCVRAARCVNHYRTG